MHTNCGHRRSLVPHAHDSRRYVGLTRTQLCSHVHACILYSMYVPWEEGGSKRGILASILRFASKTLAALETTFHYPFPPSITLSLPPSVDRRRYEPALLDLFHQQPILLNPWPCTCSTLDHAPAPTTVVVVVELFTNYYNCSYRKFTRNVPIVGKIPTINRKESSSTCMNTIKAKPPLEKPRFCNNQLAHS